MNDNEDVVRELHELECWERLAEREFGRLAFHLTDEVHIVPVNYLVDDDRVVFCTSEGSKLLGIVMNHDVAFEVDEVLDHSAWSVVARGRANILEHTEPGFAERLQRRSWVQTDKAILVAIEVNEVTGREFDLARDPD
ncbi:pyridoxamine 5'-phosphate oxidase family protein [Knoellia sp. Soil729]|uniref:pyridoxamine 5'-phosphate oxidase family protein n=1 Tax=Knoellia sp. Soil729 TaxID=1736394 RepID=UPI0006FAA858|nr:pyridoxamine 5'-phosphate oxidase family protein [Knoellia sp. Soil729]KRE43692.1 pyridoxamine 5'-phosphate oxidase [Knoellia sp. Soil729]